MSWCQQNGRSSPRAVTAELPPYAAARAAAPVQTEQGHKGTPRAFTLLRCLRQMRRAPFVHTPFYAARRGSGYNISECRCYSGEYYADIGAKEMLMRCRRKRRRATERARRSNRRPAEEGLCRAHVIAARAYGYVSPSCHAWFAIPDTRYSGWVTRTPRHTTARCRQRRLSNGEVAMLLFYALRGRHIREGTLPIMLRMPYAPSRPLRCATALYGNGMFAAASAIRGALPRTIRPPPHANHTRSGRGMQQRRGGIWRDMAC